MIKNRIMSSLELLSVSKPRVTLILKDLVDELIQLSLSNSNDDLSNFKYLYNELKARNVDDIPSYISNNIVDYNIKINNTKTSINAAVDLYFQSGFIIDKLNINLIQK